METCINSRTDKCKHQSWETWWRLDSRLNMVNSMRYCSLSNKHCVCVCQSWKSSHCRADSEDPTGRTPGLSSQGRVLETTGSPRSQEACPKNTGWPPSTDHPGQVSSIWESCAEGRWVLYSRWNTYISMKLTWFFSCIKLSKNWETFSNMGFMCLVKRLAPAPLRVL